MSAAFGKFMTAFTLAEGYTGDDREDLLGRVYSALSQDKLSLDVDPAAAHQPWYDAARALLKQPADVAHLNSMMPADQKIPMVLSAAGSNGRTHIHLEMNAMELQEAAMAAHHLMNSEMADILGHGTELKTSFSVDPQEARNLAQSIVDGVPASRGVADVSAQGRLSEKAQGRAA
jgi:hypothetical protein